jgi:Fe-S-cluster-containing hydrogenase component 2
MIDTNRCRGHMTCMRVCPTQAIRVRDATASISEELCVDCGVCISTCPDGAVVPISDTIGDYVHFKYRVVVPSPVLYSQFDPGIHPYIIHQAFKELGFDEVVDVSTSSNALARALMKYMEGYKGRLPLIASHCPCVIRLIQVKYPDLVELIVPLDAPREVTAREIRKTFPKKLGLKPEEIGIFYTATCPAKTVSIKQPAEKSRSWFDVVIAIRDVYPVLLPHIVSLKEQFDPAEVPEEFTFNTGWINLGSITHQAGMENWLSVSGLSHVQHILDDIENSRLRNIDFVEGMACMLGCLGGSFNVENPYVARTNTMKQKRQYETPVEVDDDDIANKIKTGYYMLENPVLPRPTTYFDTDLETSIKRMRERERVYRKLRQIDCGCCGSPTCMAFAEDFVRGEVKLTDCIFLAGTAEEE